MLKTNCGVCRAFDPDKYPKGVAHPEIKNYTALWDTGATNSVITDKVARELGLIPTGFTKCYDASGEKIVATYVVNILLPNSVLMPIMTVTEGNLNGMDVLIGMDIISNGDFSICNKDGKTCFSFQLPSTHEYDYVKEIDNRQHTPIKKEKEPENNDICPCGSGKKYKKCCKN